MGLVDLSILLAASLFIFPKEAHAYIDPGSGSYIIQIILAGVFGSLFALKLYWKKVSSFVGRLFSKKRQGKDDK